MAELTIQQIKVICEDHQHDDDNELIRIIDYNEFLNVDDINRVHDIEQNLQLLESLIRKEISGHILEMTTINDSYSLNSLKSHCDAILSCVDRWQHQKKRLEEEREVLIQRVHIVNDKEVEKLIRSVAIFIKENSSQIAKLLLKHPKTTNDIMDFCLAIGPAIADKYADLQGLTIVAIIIILARRGLLKHLEMNNN